MGKPNSKQRGKRLRLEKVKGSDVLEYRMYRGERLIAEIEDIPFEVIDPEGNLHTPGTVIDINTGRFSGFVESYARGRGRKKEEAAFEAAEIKAKAVNGDASKEVLIIKRGVPILSIRIENLSWWVTAPGAMAFLE